MPGTLTAANAVITLTIPGLFATPQQLQQFSAENIFETDAIEPVEVSMGLDGVLSGGFKFVPIKQGYSLQANSPSVTIFDQWNNAQQVAVDAFFAIGTILLPGIKQKWTLSNGFLTEYPPMPNAAKILAPRKFSITWQSVQQQPTS